MTETVKLSDLSRQVGTAVASFDEDALAQLAARLEAAVRGEVEVEHEPIESIQARQRVLAEILIATEQNIHVLRRLRERKARNAWEL